MRQIPYATQWIDKEDINAVVEALKSSYLTQGPLVNQFEKQVAEYCGVKYAVAVNSGTSALHAACFAAGIGFQDEVITSPITFVASANCVLYCGGKPIFADIQEDTINIDPQKIENKMTSKTKAIILVHFAGHPCDMEEISAIAQKHGLIVIEDAAHALGSEYKGAKIGSCKYSDMTVLSFHAVKHITTGEGGMVLTNNEKYYKKLLMFRSHGITREKSSLLNANEGAWYYEMQLLGFNYRITDFQCALGISQFKKLDKLVAMRRKILSIYNNGFKEINDVFTPKEKDGIKSSWHIYYIRVKNNRKELFDYLRAKGVGANVHYIPVYFQPFYQELGFKKGLCPNAEKYYSEAITLPLYPKMTEEDVHYVIEKVREGIKNE